MEARMNESADFNSTGDQAGGQALVYSRPRVVVKFHDFVTIPYEDGVEKHILHQQVEAWDRLAQDFPGITMQRLFKSIAPERIQALVDRAVELDPTYHPPNLLTYFAIECRPDFDPAALAKALLEWCNVQAAYVESRPAPPPQAINPSDDPRYPNQGYLQKAPDGIDAAYAWQFTGGGGKGIQFVDMERGWMLNHEDLVAAKIKLLFGVNKTDFQHGTGVLGVVVAADNQTGGIGIAPHASAQVVSEYQTLTSTSLDRPDAILAAINFLQFGDVLLLEAQSFLSQSSTALVPVETESAVFDMVRLATALGIVTVEAAGNGNQNLDQYGISGKQVLNRSSHDFKDSGAIMVGAARSTSPHKIWSLGAEASNYGSRVDCYAWGESVDTCWTDSTGTQSQYTTGFNGTSSASAIIAGAALVVQGIARASLNRRFSAWQLRAILSDEKYGTPAESPPIGEGGSLGGPGIGVMPDLKAILIQELNVAADVYIRDFVGDKGDSHSGAINASPDIILVPAKVAGPQASFGEGSGTEDSNTLGSEAVAKQDNYIYVRLRNRGGSDAVQCTAALYWSEVATLITPDKWNYVDSVTIPNVPVGELLTVSDALIWYAKDIPKPGHYCFVGLVGNAQDPAPVPADFKDWNKFYRFIRDNNNVTWRNFNVVPNLPPPPSSPADYVQLPFIAPGWPETAMRFQLEVKALLPAGARVWLEAPRYLVEAMGERSPFVKPGRQRNTARLPVNPRGRTTFGEALFPASVRPQLKLLVNIPQEFRENEYEVFVSQLYQGEEVGRVTWRLVPPKRIGRIKLP
jgi:Subtilase family